MRKGQKEGRGSNDSGGDGWYQCNAYDEVGSF